LLLLGVVGVALVAVLDEHRPDLRLEELDGLRVVGGTAGTRKQDQRGDGQQGADGGSHQRLGRRVLGGRVTGVTRVQAGEQADSDITIITKSTPAATVYQKQATAVGSGG